MRIFALSARWRPFLIAKINILIVIINLYMIIFLDIGIKALGVNASGE